MIARALELRPDDGYIADSLGWVYYMRARPLLAAGNVARGRGVLERAIEELERARGADRRRPGDLRAPRRRATCALGQKQRRARDATRRRCALEPRPTEQPELREKLERLRQELRKK